METPLQQKVPASLEALEQCHNPYFSGNSFTTELITSMYLSRCGHNPYFSGNSFTTAIATDSAAAIEIVTILILVETPLQHDNGFLLEGEDGVTILILVETPLQQRKNFLILSYNLPRSLRFSTFMWRPINRTPIYKDMHT